MRDFCSGAFVGWMSWEQKNLIRREAHQPRKQYPARGAMAEPLRLRNGHTSLLFLGDLPE